RALWIRSGTACAIPGSSGSGSSPGPYALNGRQVVYLSPCSSCAARVYTSPASFENPYAERGVGHWSRYASVVGNSPARSNTIEEDTYTNRSTGGASEACTSAPVNALFTAVRVNGSLWKFAIPPTIAARWITCE